MCSTFLISPEDDVIVRTIPSGKSKQTSESARPKGDKGKAPSAGGGKAAGDTQRASGRESKGEEIADPVLLLLSCCCLVVAYRIS